VVVLCWVAAVDDLPTPELEGFGFGVGVPLPLLVSVGLWTLETSLLSFVGLGLNVFAGADVGISLGGDFVFDAFAFVLVFFGGFGIGGAPDWAFFAPNAKHLSKSGQDLSRSSCSHKGFASLPAVATCTERSTPAFALTSTPRVCCVLQTPPLSAIAVKSASIYGILRSRLSSMPFPKASALSEIAGWAYIVTPPCTLALRVNGIAVRAGSHPENLPLPRWSASISTIALLERPMRAPKEASTSPVHSSIVKPTSTSRKAPILAKLPTLTPSIGMETSVFSHRYSLASVPDADRPS